MFNPLVDSFAELSDAEVENKTIDLQRKYFMTNNASVQMQMAAILEMYQEETRCRRANAYQKQNEQNGEKGLDKLININ
jgi:hypothetical protein|tara:strand:+ start:5286 stop:5522 length:237 start_codon:yes stop_codon:yes gene_type:complete